MSRADEIRTKVGLPPPNHVGVVVRDTNKAAEYYSSIFGIGPFTIYEWVPDKYWIREEPAHLKLLMGKAMWGDIEWELIQPLEGKTLHKEFLETHGEGLQHLGFVIPNYDEMFDRFIEAGFAPLVRFESRVEAYKGSLKSCYFDTRSIGGVIFEIIWRSWWAKS